MCLYIILFSEQSTDKDFQEFDESVNISIC